jgi:hypothetical protein
MTGVQKVRGDATIPSGRFIENGAALGLGGFGTSGAQPSDVRVSRGVRARTFRRNGDHRQHESLRGCIADRGRVLRLYVGGPYESTGALQLDKADGSAQFVGEVSAQGQYVSGSGMVIGQRYVLPASDRLCDEPAPAEVRLTVRSDEARGEIEVTTRKGVETWTLNLQAWSNY